MRYLIAALSVLALPCLAEPAPPGDYTVDKPHASLILRLDHMGFSHFTARFTHIDATLKFDPLHPSASRVEARVATDSLSSDNPPVGFLSELIGKEWLDAGRFPTITFHTTKVELTGANSAKVTGDLTLHGVTHPLTLDAVYNGGYPGMALDPNARIGFSAHGALKRSDYGIAYGIPAPGTKMGVGDTVDITIEAEFNGPHWQAPKR